MRWEEMITFTQVQQVFDYRMQLGEDMNMCVYWIIDSIDPILVTSLCNF